MPARLTWRRQRAPRGYSLVELAILLAVVGLLAGASLVPLGWLWEEETYRNEEVAMQRHKDALLGYALVHSTAARQVQVHGNAANTAMITAMEEIPAGRPYLPCPDINGDGYEDRIDSVAGLYVEEETLTVHLDTSDVEEKGSCPQTRGVLPWKTLGVPPADTWGNRYTYQVDHLFADAAAGFSHESIPNGVEPRLPVTLLAEFTVAAHVVTATVSFVATTFLGTTLEGHSYTITVPGGYALSESLLVTITTPSGASFPALVTVTFDRTLNYTVTTGNSDTNFAYVYQPRAENYVGGGSVVATRTDRLPRLVCTMQGAQYDLMCRENAYEQPPANASEAHRLNYPVTAPLGVAFEGAAYVIVSHGKNGHGAVNHWASSRDAVLCNAPVDSPDAIQADTPVAMADTSPHLDEINNYPFMWEDPRVTLGLCRLITRPGSAQPYVPQHFINAPRRKPQHGRFFDDVLVWSMRQELFQQLVSAGKLPARPLPIFYTTP